MRRGAEIAFLMLVKGGCMSGMGKDGEHRLSVYSSAYAKSWEKQGG